MAQLIDGRALSKKIQKRIAKKVSSLTFKPGLAVVLVGDNPAGLVVVGSEGFQSTIQMTAKTSNVSGVGDLVGSLYNAGAAMVDQPVLNVEDQDRLEEQATKEALKDAKDQINKISLRNFKFIKKMVAFSEQSSGTTSTSSVRPELFSQELSEGAESKGTFKIAKLVTVSYKLW